MSINAFAWRCLMWAHIAQLTALCREVSFEDAPALATNAGWLVRWGRMCLETDVAEGAIVEGPEGSAAIEHQVDLVIARVRDWALSLPEEVCEQLSKSSAMAFNFPGQDGVLLQKLWREQWAIVVKAKQKRTSR